MPNTSGHGGAAKGDATSRFPPRRCTSFAAWLTKLVDGAWLYGLLPHHGENACGRCWRPSSKNSATASRHATTSCSTGACWPASAARKSKASAISTCRGTQQLALGHLAADYLPEVIGYNLGYEQPPLHLLITTQELRELGFDPYYSSCT